jgi:hypothetical protein
MEPQSSSPYSQVSATCSYSEPTPSSPHEYKVIYQYKIPRSSKFFSLYNLAV